MSPLRGLIVWNAQCYNHDVPPGLKIHYHYTSPGLKKSAVGTS